MQVDWHLIEHYYAGRSAAVRRSTAWLLRFFVDQFLLVPRRSTIRTVDLLLTEFAELRGLRPRIVEEVRGLGACGEFGDDVLAADDADRVLAVRSVS